MKLFTLVIYVAFVVIYVGGDQFGQRQSGGSDTVFGNGAYR